MKICKSCRCVTAFEFATSCCSSSWFLDIASFVLRETRFAPSHVKLASAAPCPLLCQCVDVTLRSLHMLHMRRRDGDVAHWRKSLLRLPKGLRRKKRICLPIIANIKKQWRALVVLMRSSKRFGARRREGILSLKRVTLPCSACRSTGTSASSWLSEDQSCNSWFQLENFSSTNQCRWSSHVLSVHSVTA